MVREADIVVAACGKAKMVKGSWLKPGAAVIDVGTNPVPDASKKSGFKCVLPRVLGGSFVCWGISLISVCMVILHGY